MPSTTNFGWTTPADTDLVKDGASAIRTLGNGIDTSFVDLKGGTTGQVLSKNSNTDLDFTWVAQDDSNAIQNALLTTTGDTIYASGASTPARLGIGSSGQVLTVAGGVPTWATPSSGGMTLIQETTASAISSLSFSSIPGTYKQLLLIWSGIFHSATGSGFSLRINNNSDASKYQQQGNRIENNTNNTSFYTTSNVGEASYQVFGESVTSSNLYDRSSGCILIDNYASTTRFKPFEYQYFSQNSTIPVRLLLNGRGTFADTTAITSLDIYRTNGTGTFSNATSTSIRLYGVS